MRKIYLIGTDHRYQRGAAFGIDARVFDQFRAMLCDKIHRHGIRGIAEEMSEEGLGPLTDGSVGFFLAKKLNLLHRYCDPDTAQRKAHSIGKLEREHYWLSQLCSFEAFPALFILGSTHVETFKSLLHHAGFQVQVENPDWEPSPITN